MTSPNAPKTEALSLTPKYLDYYPKSKNDPSLDFSISTYLALKNVSYSQIDCFVYNHVSHYKKLFHKATEITLLQSDFSAAVVSE